jgi:sugar lactone lactonase YvrE
MEASVLIKVDCLLGEGPLWHAGRNTLFWVDIERRKIHAYDHHTHVHHVIDVPFRPSALFEGEADHLYVAVQGGLQKLNLNDHRMTWLLDIEKSIPGNRCNDGRCDAEGRLWIGTMELNCLPGLGSLYCVHPDLTIEKKLSNLTIPNGITWSLDQQRMYHTDTGESEIRSYHFDREQGAMRFEKVAIKVPPGIGKPDGMAMDERGMFWVAHWDGHGVYCWNPETGKVMEKISLPVPKVTACAFGGVDRDELFITTAGTELSPEERTKYPLSGSVFRAKPGVRGAKVHGFKVSQ